MRIRNQVPWGLEGTERIRSRMMTRNMARRNTKLQKAVSLEDETGQEEGRPFRLCKFFTLFHII